MKTEKPIDIVKNKEMLKKWLAPDKLAIGVLLGALLLVVTIPANPQNENTEKKQSVNVAVSSSFEEEYVKQMEDKLAKTLLGIGGMKQVRVMITLKASKEEIINKDTPYSQSMSSEINDGEKREQTDVENKVETVLVSEDGDTKPYVIKELYPEIEGILVVIDGNIDVMLKSEITEVIQVLFGVESHKVKVLGSNL